ncbi:MAG TPA: hypothetical protein VGY58_20050 [Gemmataceae bacterium]|jgi:hypothetical protein|nr:hypothetical protein [Gemmataceae bacterium]
MLSTSLCGLINRLVRWLRGDRQRRPPPRWMSRPRPCELADDPYATIRLDNGV